MPDFHHTFEQLQALERKREDAAANGKVPATTRWYEVHYQGVKMLKLLAEFAETCHSVEQVRCLARIVNRAQLLENTRDPHPDHFVGERFA